MTTSAMADRWNETGRRLGELLSRAPAEPLRIRPIAPTAGPKRAAAIDGSSTVLAQGGAFLVGAHRAAAVHIDGDASRILAGEVDVSFLHRQDVDAELRERFGAAGLLEVPRSLEVRLGLLRQLDELDAAHAAASQLGRGDILLLDGPLRLDPFPSATRDLFNATKARGTHIVGVCKSTSIAVGPVPALAACTLAARAEGLRRWAVELPLPPMVEGHTFIAALSAAESRAFRFDIHPAAGEAEDVLAMLPGLAGHPAYPGYPSPLAMAHNAVTITEDRRVELAARLEDAASRHGVTSATWRAAFEDYHDILDLGV